MPHALDPPLAQMTSNCGGGGVTGTYFPEHELDELNEQIVHSFVHSALELLAGRQLYAALQ